MSQKDLVVKMTINSTEFENGIRNAKNSVKSLDSQTSSLKSIAAFAGKAAIAIGAATAAVKTYNSFAKQSQYFGDKLNNTIDACKTSWQGLQHEILMGGNLAASQIKTLYNEAKKLAELRDELGTDVISQRFFRMKYVTPFNEAITDYQEAKKKGDSSGMSSAMDKMGKAYTDYAEHSQKTIDDANKTVQQFLKTEKINIGNKSAIDLVEELVNAQQGYLSEETKIFKHYFELSQKGALHNEYREEIWSVKHPTYMTGKYGVDMPYGYEGARYAMEIKGYTKEQIDAAERQYRLSQITDEEYNQALDVLETGDKVLNELSQMRRRMTRVSEKETTSSNYPSSSPNTRTPVDLIPSLPPIKILEDEDAVFKRINDRMQKQAEQEETNALLMTVGNMLYQERIDKLNSYATAIGQFSNMFAELTNLAADGSPWQRFGAAIGGVLGEISKLMSTYASLIAIESVAESIKAGNGIPFPYNLIAIAAAGTALLGIISSLKGSFQDAGSFATGGIVGGNSYTGDRLIAHVNSGEMILNRSQQMALFGRPSDDVHFIIEGSQLVGVIDNFNKTQDL